MIQSTCQGAVFDAALRDVALAYLGAGLSVLPARADLKFAALSEWAPYQDRLPTEQEVAAWFADPRDALCLVTGRASGNLEMLDFDGGGELYAAWCAAVRERSPGLLDKLVVESSPSGGRHAAYRCESAVCGSMKLAQRRVVVPGPGEVTIQGKRFKPRLDKSTGEWFVVLTLIETRGEGGLFLCAPSRGYRLVQGGFTALPVLTAAEREVLLESAWALNEYVPEALGTGKPDGSSGGAAPAAGDRPGDEFNRRGEVRAVLEAHGWRRVKGGDNEYWRRPGKDHGWSATLKDGVFYVFTSNAAPFEQDTAYAPFAVYAMLNHDGDFSKAAARLRSEGYGSKDVPVGGQAADAGPTAPAEVVVRELTPEDLFNYDTDNDPNTLLGQRWLCRSGSCLLVGQTGLGKSSFCVQAAVAWGLGESLFGIAPVRPLKSLIIQAENDTGDLAEMFRGVLTGTDRVGMLGHVQSQMVFVTDTAHGGEGFHPFARALILKHRPDLVWVDPLFACIGGSVSDQETVSGFLRNGLGAIAQETGVAWMIAHHANKPPRDPAVRNALVGGDYSYLGSGSAELANWARAVLVLREFEDGLYELRAAKRGRRAGLVDADGVPATEIYLKHGEVGICWERAPAPEDERRAADMAYAEEVVASMEKERIHSRVELRQIVEQVLGVKKSAVLTRGRRAYRVYQLALGLTARPDGALGHMVTSGHAEVM